MTTRSLRAAARIAGAVLIGWLALGLAPATRDAAPAAAPAAPETSYIWQPSHGPTGGSILGFGVASGAGGQRAITAVNGALFGATLGGSPVWSPISLGNLPASISFTGFGASPTFAQDGQLYVSGYTSDTSSPEFYISSDGGRTWSLNTTIACGAARVSPNFAVDHFMIAGCATNSVMLSTDGGAS